MTMVFGVQAQIISYPKVYYGDGTNKPFDKAFDLMVPFRQQENVYYVYLYKHRGNKSFRSSIAKEKGSLPLVLLSSGWEQNKAADTNYHRVEFRYRPDDALYTLLKPGQTYSLIFFQGVTAGSKNIIEAMRTEYNSNPRHLIEVNGTAQGVYQAEVSRQIEGHKIQTYKEDFNLYRVFYSEVLRPLEDSLQNLLRADSISAVPCDSMCLNRSCLEEITALANGKGCTQAGFLCTDTCQFTRALLSLYRLNCASFTSYVKGLSVFSEKGMYTPVEGDHGEERMAALEKSMGSIGAVRNFLFTISGQLNGEGCRQGRECVGRTSACLQSIEALLVQQRQRLKAIAGVRKKINEAIVESRLFIDYDISSVDSYVYNFQSRNELAITPVFGYAYYGFQKGFNGFTPYLGFQVNFKALNRDDPFHQIHRKTPGQLLCFTTAWTLTGMQEPGKRGDLFDKSSLITALGVKLSHVLMFNSGVLWFKKQNANALITSKSIAATPVISLSVNMEIDKLLNGFTKLIPIK